MKKFVLIFALASVFSFSMVSQENQEKSESSVGLERHEERWSTMTYFNVPILKILDSRDAYVVIYQKNRMGTGSTVIPKRWIYGNKDNPQKLKLRTTRTANGAYMTVIKDNGEFVRVVLTAPLSKNNPVWGVVARGKEVEGADKDTLEELAL
ncbi:MAG: hypothetical protein J1E07_02455 [Treponema sp.]|nr:hypothetical protein [Treponema sp.]